MSPEQTPLLPDGMAVGGTAPFPDAAVWTSGSGSRATSGLPRLPLNIGHRGYKAAFPENSMAAFHGALAAGAHALETDLHLSRDGVVVLSHDPTLKRCFGVDAKIADCDWSYLRTLQTLREPRQGMPRLSDLLEWLAGLEGADSVWVLLDVKTDDDPERLLPAVARTIAGVPLGGSGGGWKGRVVVGCWNENYIQHARLHLPGHPLAYIGFSLLYARKFLTDDHRDVHFNLFQPALVGPIGAAFRREVRKRGRKLFVWTVNEEGWMEWSVRKGVDGVITDEVGLFKEVRDRFGGGDGDAEGEGESGVGVTAGMVFSGRSGKGNEGVRWPRMLRLYCLAFFWQGVAALVSLLLWHRLSNRGRGRKGKKADGAAMPGKT